MNLLEAVINAFRLPELRNKLLFTGSLLIIYRLFANITIPGANPAALRRVCALGTLQMIYSALAAASTSPANLMNRAELYEQMYKRALRNASVGVDLDGDGAPDVVRPLNLLEMQRA